MVTVDTNSTQKQAIQQDNWGVAVYLKTWCVSFCFTGYKAELFGEVDVEDNVFG
jgi:hypothetical protein